MKKLLSLLLFVAPTMLYAQLKVESDGKVLVGDHHWNSEYVNLESYSIFSSSQSKPIVVGVKTHSGSFYDNGICIGVEGLCCNPVGSVCYGVGGFMDFTYNGAGVFGTTGTSRLAITGQYAGYFNGATYVNGTLTTTSLNNQSDIRLTDNIQSLSNGSSRVSMLGKVRDLDVLTYTFKDREMEYVDTALTAKAGKPVLSKMLVPSDGKMHYGLSAQELQKIYPELVSEGQDGFLTVNYIELIPILIRSIQELETELEEVRGGTGDAALSRGTTSAGAATAAPTGNVLYQNTPNPFKEQTTIRFSLADDTRDAAICIFDMTGKMLKKMPISSGETSVAVNGWELGEGMFLYTLIVNGREIDTKKMILSK